MQFDSPYFPLKKKKTKLKVPLLRGMRGKFETLLKRRVGSITMNKSEETLIFRYYEKSNNRFSNCL